MSIETDIGKRWEDGTEHHPETIKLMEELKAVDKLNGYAADDMMDTGGDGDPGELLMYLMDVVFEQRASKPAPYIGHSDLCPGDSGCICGGRIRP